MSLYIYCTEKYMGSKLKTVVMPECDVWLHGAAVYVRDLWEASHCMYVYEWYVYMCVYIQIYFYWIYNCLLV